MLLVGGVELFRLLLASTCQGASRASRTEVSASWRRGIIPPPTRFYSVPLLDAFEGTMLVRSYYSPTTCPLGVERVGDARGRLGAYEDLGIALCCERHV